MNVREMGALLRAGKTSCVELVDRSLAAIQEQRSLHAFITVTDTQARAEAIEKDRELRSGFDRGPFHGIPIALKDLFYTKGIKTTGGSRLFQDFVPDFDAEVVERLRTAGAISLGKTNLHELAFGITSRNPFYGSVLNPRNRSRLAGGSSGGSAAAVAAGIVPMALGTDTGGSIRIPSSFCGIVGLKPTYGRVSRRGVLPLAFSLDHVGPLGSCVEDCALALNVMADRTTGFDPSVSPDFKTLRIGIPRKFFFNCLDDQVATRVENSISILASHGAKVYEVQLPDMNEVNVASRVVQGAEFASHNVNWNDRSMFGSDVWSLLQQGRLIAGHEYVNAQRLRSIFRQSMNSLWDQIDMLVTPTTPITAPPINADNVTVGVLEETVRMASTRLVRGFNYLGEPALSMPCGKTNAGLPVGLQLISAPYTEGHLLQIAHALEKLLGRFPFER